MQRDEPNLGIPDPAVADTLLKPPVIPPAQPGGLLSTPNTPGAPGADTGDLFSRLTKGAGILSDALGKASQPADGAKKLSPSSPSRPLLPQGPQEPLITGGLLSGPRAGIDLNRFFGLLSGRVM